MIRLAILGGGAIADFHAPACREAGFRLAAVASRPRSGTVAEFAERHAIPTVHEDPESLLDDRSGWDALLISVPTADTLAILRRALLTRAPILVEKPISVSADDVAQLRTELDELAEGKVIVGYNRRFYPAAEAARRFVQEGTPVTAQLQLPESVTAPDEPSGREYLDPLFINSVHGLDLARYVFGDLRVEAVRHVRNSGGGIVQLGALFSSSRGDLVHMIGNWGAPANYALALDRPGHRLQLLPLETGTRYSGMEVVEPTPERPTRTYRPKEVGKTDLAEADPRLKPGFLGQAQAFKALCEGTPGPRAARLVDAEAALRLADALVASAL